MFPCSTVSSQPHTSTPRARPCRPCRAATLANLDAAEDAAAEHCWCWELRDLRHIPKAARAAADPHRKHRKALQDRLRAAAAFVEAASVHGAGKALEGKVARAAARLRKLPGLAAAREQLGAALEGAAGKAAGGGKRQIKVAAAAAAVAPAVAVAQEAGSGAEADGGAAGPEAMEEDAQLTEVGEETNLGLTGGRGL
jgi:hypothetical protein